MKKNTSKKNTSKKTNLKKLLSLISVCGLILSLGGCSGTSKTKETTETEKGKGESAVIVLRVGASPSPHAEILKVAAEKLKAEGIELQIEEFTDYIMPNKALESNELDANFFQHKPYMDDFNTKNGTKLASAAAIHFEPMGIYPGKSKDISEIGDKVEIAVPSDPTNEARALLFLEKQGLLKIKEGKGLDATAQDIAENPYNIKIVEMEAAQLPRTLEDVDFAVINGNYAVEAGIETTVLITEDSSSAGAKEFANILAVREGDESRLEIQALIKALQSEEVKTYLSNTYSSTVIPVF